MQKRKKERKSLEWRSQVPLIWVTQIAITNLRKRNYSFTHIGLTLVSSRDGTSYGRREKKSATGQTTDNVYQHDYMYTIEFLDIIFLTHPEGHAPDPPSHSSGDI